MTLLALAGVLVYLGYARSGRKHTKDDLEPEKTIATWQLLVLPLVVALMSLAFPMITDAYGDARSIIANYEEIYAKDKGLLKAFLTLIDLDIFNLHNGERFTFNAVYILRKVFNLDLKEGFQIFGAIIGVGTAIVFSIYLKISRLGFGLPYILFFLSLNSMLMFSGHIEVYGPSILLVALFALIGKIQYERNGRSTLWWLLIVLFFAIKAHFINFLLLGPYTILLLLHLKPNLVNFFTLRNLMVLFGSGVLGFFLAYFFILKNYNSHYAIREGGILSNVFLPIVSPEAPYDHYSLFHFNHIYDFLQLVLSWSPILWMVVLAGVVHKGHFKTVSGYHLIPIFVLLAYGFLSFTFNPILSMPRDWDLLSLGAPMLLVLGTEVWAPFTKRVKRKLGYTILGLFILFTLPRTFVEFHEDFCGRRLLMVGGHVYQTYYAGSSVLISKGVRLSHNPRSRDLMELVDDWMDHSDYVPDYELGHSLTQIALHFEDYRGNSQSALEFFKLALEVSPDYPIALKGAAILLENRNDYRAALPLAQRLLEINPNEKEHWQIAINCLYGLKMKKELISVCSEYINRYPEDTEKINSILSEI